MNYLQTNDDDDTDESFPNAKSPPQSYSNNPIENKNELLALSAPAPLATIGKREKERLLAS
jgi:hypothetical protein